jgi:hypothetical protein
MFDVYCKQFTGRRFYKVKKNLVSLDKAEEYINKEKSAPGLPNDFINEWIVSGGDYLVHYKEVLKPSYVQTELKGE